MIIWMSVKFLMILISIIEDNYGSGAPVLGKFLLFKNLFQSRKRMFIVEVSLQCCYEHGPAVWGGFTVNKKKKLFVPPKTIGISRNPFEQPPGQFSAGPGALDDFP